MAQPDAILPAADLVGDGVRVADRCRAEGSFV